MSRREHPGFRTADYCGGCGKERPPGERWPWCWGCVRPHRDAKLARAGASWCPACTSKSHEHDPALTEVV